MKKRYFKSIYTLLGLIGVSLLASCGESTNLKDPINAATTTHCSDLDGVCIKGRFIDDAVFNLDYECDKVIATTGVDGSFSCPLNSTVTFLIKNPADTSGSPKKITLGQTVVKNPANLGNNLPVYFYVTPATLFPGDLVARQNAVRLLHALSDDPTSADLTGHIIYISDETKRKLTNLGQAISPADFSKAISIATPATPTSPAVSSAPGSFDELLEPLLGAPVFSPPRSPMISAAKADEYLQRGINSTVAGVYTDFGILSVIGLPFGVPAMTGFNASSTMTASIWAMVDRKGRVMGAGVYSYEPITSTQFLYTNSKPMELKSVGVAGSAGAPMWPNSGNLQGMSFDMMDGNNAATSMKLDIAQGVMEREAIAGNDTLYRSLFDVAATAPVPIEKEGRWEVVDSLETNNIAASTTAFTLLRSSPAAPSLDPDLWRATQFPLHVSLRFWNSDATTPIAAGCDASGCPIGPPIQISILQDGNIVSDVNGDCSAVDPDTLQHISGSNPGYQELPLGLVQNIFTSGPKDTPANATFMTLALVLPNKPLVASSVPGDDQEKYLRYAQFLTNYGGATLMRVDGSATADYLKLHSVQSVTLADKSSAYVYDPTTAKWSNTWTVLRGIDSLNNDPAAVPPATGHVASAQTLLYQKNQQGYVRSVPAACP